jgi:hypothetical protein
MLKERTLTITVTVDMDKAIRSGEIETSVWSQIPELVFHSLLDTWSVAPRQRQISSKKSSTPWTPHREAPPRHSCVLGHVDIAYPRWDGPGVEVEA